jgi:FixJ family two-component response regulator
MPRETRIQVGRSMGEKVPAKAAGRSARAPKAAKNVARNVYVVEDDPAGRELLVELFKTANLKVKDYASAQAFLDDPPAGPRGVIVLDVRMPGMDGFALQAELARRGSGLPVVFVTAHGDTKMAVRAMKAGAYDFVEKPIDNAELVEIVRGALRLSAATAEASARKEEIRRRVDTLTPRERDVLELIAEGELNKRIAHRLGIVLRTVEVHRASIMEKMRAKSAADLIRMAMTMRDFRRGL